MIAENEIMFRLARKKIAEMLFDTSSEPISVPEHLTFPGASFVTLTMHGTLRGCVGSLVAHKPLWEDIMDNGYHAAFRDFRFPPLSAEEYPFISVEVSILSAPFEIHWNSVEDLRTKIIPGVHGVIFSCNGRRATFLPQVWEQLPDFDLFFSHLSQKAGLSPEPEFDSASIELYTVEKFHEPPLFK